MEDQVLEDLLTAFLLAMVISLSNLLNGKLPIDGLMDYQLVLGHFALEILNELWWQVFEHLCLCSAQNER